MSVSITGGVGLVELESIKKNLEAQLDLLRSVITELQIANAHNENITDEQITNDDLGENGRD